MGVQVLRDGPGGGDVAHLQDLQAAVLLLQGVAGGRAYEEAHAGDGVVVVDGICHLHQVVLAGRVVQVEVRKVGEVRLHGDPGAPGKVVDAHTGDDGRPGLGLVGIVGDDRVGGEGLRPLEEVGQGVGRLQPVLQHLAPDDQGGQHMGVFDAHSILSFLSHDWEQ